MLDRIKAKEQMVLDIQRRRSFHQPISSKPPSTTCICTGKDCDKQLDKKESAGRYYRCEKCYEKMLDDILFSPYTCMGCGERIVLPYEASYVISSHCPVCYPKWLKIGR